MNSSTFWLINRRWIFYSKTNGAIEVGWVINDLHFQFKA